MHPNEKLVRDFYEAQGRFYAGDADASELADLLTDDIAWHVPGRNAIAGDYRGRDEVFGYLEKRRDHAHSSLRIEVHHTLADDDYVMQLAGGRAEIGGVLRRWETVGVYRVNGGRIAECWLVPFDQHAFDEIWAKPR